MAQSQTLFAVRQVIQVASSSVSENSSNGFEWCQDLSGKYLVKFITILKIDAVEKYFYNFRLFLVKKGMELEFR